MNAKFLFSSSNASRIAWLIALLLVATPQAPGQPRSATGSDLSDEIALAEAQVTVKKAGLKLVIAKRAVVQVNLQDVKDEQRFKQATLKETKVEFDREENLYKSKASSVSSFIRAKAALLNAERAVEKAATAIMAAERRMAIDEAQIEFAQAELAEVELRVRLLRNRKARAEK